MKVKVPKEAGTNQEKMHSAYRALDAIIRNHFFDFVASAVLPISEEIIQFERAGKHLDKNRRKTSNFLRKS